MEVQTSTSQEKIQWTVENELLLFNAMITLQPKGINKHFYMMAICHELEAATGKSISADSVWTHVETMFDLSSVEDNDSIPFPNEDKEFSLDDSEYGEEMSKKLREVQDEPEEKSNVTKGNKDYSRVGRSSGGDSVKAERSSTPEAGSSAKGKGRGKRGPKPKEKVSQSDKESSPAASTGNRKNDEETPSSAKSSGKRTLRSRIDDKEDAASNKSITPPPKRARRF